MANPADGQCIYGIHCPSGSRCVLHHTDIETHFFASHGGRGMWGGPVLKCPQLDKCPKIGCGMYHPNEIPFCAICQRRCHPTTDHL